MHRSSCWLRSLLILSLTACADVEGAIGAEDCLGEYTDCQPRDLDGPIAYREPLVEVSSEATRDVEIIASLDIAGQCASDLTCSPSGLVSDGQLGVWLVQPTSERLEFTHYDADTRPIARVTARGPNSVSAILSWSRPILGANGELVLGATWSDVAATTTFHRELLRVNDEGSNAIPLGSSEAPTPAGAMAGLKGPMHVVSNGDGFVVTLFSTREHWLRQVDGAGRLIWQQSGLPGLQTSPLLLPQASGFAALGTPSDEQLRSSTAFLWFDPDGNITDQVVLVNANAGGGGQALALSDGRVAYAETFTALAPDKITEGLAFASAGQTTDLYVARVARDGSQSGHRIVNDSAIVPRASAITRDQEDTIYVSTTGGTRAEPQSLICRLPEFAEPGCYRLPKGVFPLHLEVAGPGTLFAATTSQLLRIALPE